MVWMGQASKEPPVLDFFDWSGGSSATMRKFLYSDSDISDGEDLRTLVRLVSRGHLHPEIGGTRDWRETAAVLHALLARQVRGKLIMEVSA